MNLSAHYARYLNDEAEEFIRTPERLYVTDIGACPRRVAYRLTGADENAETEQATINKTIMFDLAEHIESVLARALEHDGKLLGFQGGVPITDHENWGGRYDIFADYGGRRIVEVKTMRSNAFNYELPKIEHEYQAAVYHHYLKDELQLERNPVLVYFDRGGSNTPQEFEVQPHVWDAVSELMHALDEMRAALPELPPQLPRQYVLRSRNTEVKDEPDHRCGYCPYSDICKPDMSKKRVAYRRDGMWRQSKGCDAQKLLDFGIAITEVP